MKKSYVIITLIDETSQHKRSPVTILFQNDDVYKVLRIVSPEDYNRAIQFPKPECDRIYLFFDRELSQGQEISLADFEDFADFEKGIILKDIVQADLIIFGGGAQRPLKSVLKNIIYE